MKKRESSGGEAESATASSAISHHPAAWRGHQLALAASGEISALAA
jgi:hypothetical protein